MSSSGGGRKYLLTRWEVHDDTFQYNFSGGQDFFINKFWIFFWSADVIKILKFSVLTSWYPYICIIIVDRCLPLYGKKNSRRKKSNVASQGGWWNNLFEIDLRRGSGNLFSERTNREIYLHTRWRSHDDTLQYKNTPIIEILFYWAGCLTSEWYESSSSLLRVLKKVFELTRWVGKFIGLKCRFLAKKHYVLFILRGRIHK